jgi:hypothetical protein
MWPRIGTSGRFGEHGDVRSEVDNVFSGSQPWQVMKYCRRFRECDCDHRQGLVSFLPTDMSLEGFVNGIHRLVYIKGR